MFIDRVIKLDDLVKKNITFNETSFSHPMSLFWAIHIKGSSLQFLTNQPFIRHVAFNAYASTILYPSVYMDYYPLELCVCLCVSCIFV